MYNCLDNLYHCSTSASSKNNYPIGYGLKYCSRFGSSSRGSDYNRWRDATLKCLQDQLKPYLQSNPSASCADLTEYAFDSHPKCYTTEGASICNLGFRDQFFVATTVSPSDLLSIRSAKQMAEVLKICAEGVAEDVVDVATGPARMVGSWIAKHI